jgi:RING-like zinc finger
MNPDACLKECSMMRLSTFKNCTNAIDVEAGNGNNGQKYFQSIRMSTFVDDSTECAICLIAFSEDTAAAITTLKCGHRWHTDCLREQLRTALPNHSQRLVFTGCRCAKCGTYCDDDHNPELQEFTRKTDGLRQRVDQLIREQLRVDNAVTRSSPF